MSLTNKEQSAKSASIVVICVAQLEADLKPHLYNHIILNMKCMHLESCCCHVGALGFNDILAT